MANVHLGIVFVVSFLFYEYSTFETTSPIYQLGNVVRFFNTTELCDHICDAKTWYDDYGSLNIRFKTKIKSGENSGKNRT